jgi:hypothetical protein
MPGGWDAKRAAPHVRLTAWASSRQSIAARLAGKVLAPARDANPRSRQTQVEQIAQASELAGLDLVADALHTPWAPPPPPTNDAAAFFAAQSGGLHGPWLKVEEGAVLFRHSAPWDRREAEIPKSRLDLLGSRLKDEAWHPLDAAGELAAASSEPHLEHLSLFPPFRPSEPLAPLGTKGRLLAFWGALGKQDRETALQHIVVPYSSLTSGGKAALRRLLTDFLLVEHYGTIPSDLMRAILADDLRPVAMLVEPVVQRFVATEVDGVTVLTPLAEDSKAADRAWRQYNLYFGLDATRAIRVTAELPLPPPSKG